MQSSDGDTDIENRLMDKGGGEEGEGEVNEPIIQSEASQKEKTNIIF